MQASGRKDISILTIQIGARHNYAAPIIFDQAGYLGAFYTDLVSNVGLGRWLSALNRLPMPNGLSKSIAKIARRTVPDSVASRTRTVDVAALKFELSKRRAGSVSDHHKAQADFRDRSNALMARWGTGQATHIYTIFGEGHDCLVKAKAAGIPVIADIVIALSTAEIDDAEHQLYPDWGAEPYGGHAMLRDAYAVRRDLLQVVDVFLCPSNFVGDDLVDNHGVSRDRVRVLPYALSSEWFDIRPDPVPGRVLFVGSVTRRKGIHYLAKAANLIQKNRDDIEFRVAGGAAPIVTNHPEAAGLNFLGRVPRSEIKDEFAAADIFVLPSLAEGSATVVYEAMSAGLAIITTHSSGSVIEDGVNGLIVPERDPEALAAAIIKLVEDRALRDRLASAARRDSRNYDWDNYAQGLLKVIEDTPSPVPPAQ